MNRDPWQLIFQHRTCRKVPDWANPRFFLDAGKARCAYMAHAPANGGLATPVTTTELPGNARLRAQVELWHYVVEPVKYIDAGVTLQVVYRNEDTGAARLYMDIRESLAYKSREHELWVTIMGMLPLKKMGGKALVYHYKYPEWTDTAYLGMLGGRD